jgi:hypothetical protein
VAEASTWYAAGKVSCGDTALRVGVSTVSIACVGESFVRSSTRSRAAFYPRSTKSDARFEEVLTAVPVETMPDLSSGIERMRTPTFAIDEVDVLSTAIEIGLCRAFGGGARRSRRVETFDICSDTRARSAKGT